MPRYAVAIVVLLLACGSGWASEFEPARTHAVIVGVLEWKNALTAFPRTNRKDVELREVLIRRGVQVENIEMLLDVEATLQNIQAAIARSVSRAASGSTLIIYYAGHGFATRTGDYCLANYDMRFAEPQTAWSLEELGAKLANNFKGKQVFLWADCCYSGGLHVVVDALAKKRIAAFSLTSAGTANTSTRNWTFTQSIIDGLRGEPIVDANGDGRVTLIELSGEVRDAMQHMEGQAYGFKSNAIGDGFVLARATGARPRANNATYPIGSYVETTNGGSRHFGRVVGTESGQLVVQFYDYTDKQRAKFDVRDVAPSTRKPRAPTRLDVGMKPDCETEWEGQWFPAKVLKRETVGDKPRYLIHYLGYDSSWDEWVGSERIRFLDGK